jgi:hypothetical protein
LQKYTIINIVNLEVNKMTEPIDELKRRIVKGEIQHIDSENDHIQDKNIGEFKGHKIEQINPINSRTRGLFKKNIQNRAVEGEE